VATPRRTAAKKSSARKSSAKKQSSAKKPATTRSSTRKVSARKSSARKTDTGRALEALARDVVGQLERIERAGGDGELDLGRGRTLHVSSLDKAYFPKAGLTKGDLMRYYARVAPVLLPAIADRPLALKRYPEGAAGFSFFQQDPGEHVPEVVRVEEVDTEDKGRERRLVGGDLATLLYTAQIGTIAVNAWHSRMRSLRRPDYCVLDLDPGEGIPFPRIVQAALWVREALRGLKLDGVPKTSGSRGIHVVIPLGPRATYDLSAEVAETVAVAVAEAHPEHATVERSLSARPRGTIYVDHLQNAYGKTLASVLSVRAKPAATVSMPLSWRQLNATLDPTDFTLETVPRRLAAARLAWAAVGKARPGRSS